MPQPTSPLSSSPQVILNYPVTSGTSAASSTAWFADLRAAQAQAKATNRPLVAVFSGSDWCQPCVVFEQEVFSQPAFTAYAHNRLVLAHFDYPRQAQNQPTPAQAQLNQAAAAQLNREGDFPLAVIVSPEGKVLAKTGYIAGGPAAFQAYLNKVLGK
ncbi:thioredoxin family protein [Hymenobacter sp. B1770]|uniref:thioredoxin family protein n=1 Tax=Hymenobacter sp. B1770 TaxID=1718788 RepID=UPI003CFB0913